MCSVFLPVCFSLFVIICVWVTRSAYTSYVCSYQLEYTVFLLFRFVVLIPARCTALKRSFFINSIHTFTNMCNTRRASSSFAKTFVLFINFPKIGGINSIKKTPFDRIANNIRLPNGYREMEIRNHCIFFSRNSERMHNVLRALNRKSRRPNKIMRKRAH